jgi:hypothetical protein
VFLSFFYYILISATVRKEVQVRFRVIMENEGTENGPPASVTAAVLQPSVSMPAGSQKVVELDFNAFAGRDVTVQDLISGMNNMGFQASSIGEAVRIINKMVRFCSEVFSRLLPLFARHPNVNSEIRKQMRRLQYS